jgi:hypothetical protein
LDALVKGYTDLGVEADNAAVKELLRMRSMMTGNEKLFAGVSALSQGLITLSKLGALNVDVFNSVAQQGVDMFRRMQGVVASAGGTHADALRPFVPWLAEMRRAAKEYGFVLDATTQEMIDQAEELGMLKPEAKSTAEVMEAGFNKVVASLDKLIGRLETVLETLGYIGTAVSDLPDVDVGTPTVPGGTTGPGPGEPGGPGPRPGPTPGGTEEAGDYFDRGGGDRTTVTQNFNITSTDAATLAEMVRRDIAPMLKDSIRRNDGGIRTGLLQELK